MSQLLIFTWPYALFFWVAYVWAVAPEFRIALRQREAAASSQDAHSKQLIVAGQGLAILAAFAIAAKVPSGAIAHREWLFWAGLISIVGGSVLRRHCWRMLGSHFTGAVVVTPDQAVVERGAYRYVRHPSYTAATILFLGIGLALANWIGLAVLLGSAAIVYGYRVDVEERALVAVIGDAYRRYMSRTKRFVPFLF